MVLVDGPRRPAPVEQRAGVQSHVTAVAFPPHKVGDETVRVQLGVTFPARAVPEPGHHPTLCLHPAANTTGLYSGHGGPLLQERERLGDGLPVGGGHHLGHRLGGEGPQQRDALGCGKSHIERPHRALPVPRQQFFAGTGRRPSTSARNCSASTTPDRPSSSAHFPAHTPGDSPTPA